MAKNIVTGAAGFIGSQLVETLLQQGEEVIGIDEFNDYYDPIRILHTYIGSLALH
jgi:nucleoside-diphosphate-sugar epimerase